MELSGPILYYKYTLGDKTIHLFGDKHVWDSLCDDNTCRQGCDRFVGNVFKNLFTKHEESDTTDIYDFYFESPYGTKDTKFYKAWHKTIMYEMAKTFTNCLVVDKSKCPYKKTRFHYIDLRWDVEEVDDLFKIAQEFSDDPTEFVNECKVFAHYFRQVLFPTGDMDVVKIITNLIAKYPRIKKQRDMIPTSFSSHPQFAGRFQQILDIAIFRAVKSSVDMGATIEVYNQLVRSLNKKKFTKSELDQIVKYIGVLYSTFMHIVSWVMDIYTIYRMIRQFVDPDPNKAQAKNIILYAGQAHVRHIAAVFDNLGGKKEYIVDEGKQCIQIPNIEN